MKREEREEGGRGGGVGEQDEREEGIQELFFFQAEDGIRDLVRSRGLGEVYKGQYIDILYMYTLSC